MQAHAEPGAIAQAPTRDARRLRDVILDFFSPTLHCDVCGADTKRRHCTRTGGVRPVPVSAGWTRWSATDVEYTCPSCGGSMWVLDAPAQYPLF